MAFLLPTRIFYSFRVSPINAIGLPFVHLSSHLLENFLQPLTVLEFTSEDATVYANVRAKLERAGTPIGPLDTLIASQAVGRKLTLVSNNEREFGRVAGLRLENWAK